MPDRLCGELADLAREQGVTLFVVLLATFKVLLFHYCGQADIAIGTIVASRTRKELEHLLGFFANALVLRTQDQDDPSFRLLLSRVHEAAIDAQANQDAPFERLVEELGKKRTLGYNPLFQSAFVLHNLPSEKLDLPGLSIRVEETSTQSAAFDVVLHVFDERPGLRMKFEYDSALFEHSTIVRMATHFSALAQNAVTRPDSRLSTLSLLDAESASKVVESSYTRMAFDTSGKLLHQLVGAFAPPNAQAVVSDASSISYDELMARARQLAHRLVGLGVGPDTLVGVLVEPSVDMVVAMLGILEANGAYLPLDPSYPSARLEHMLTDSKAIAIVTTRSGARALPKIPIASVCLDEDALSLEANPTSPLPVRARADNLAYVIYTSGSTGVPKGVMVSHGAAVASTLARRQYYSAPVSAYLLLSSIAFDSSVAGVFWTLCDGGRLCIPSERTRRDPAALVRMIERQSISHLLCLPSLYSEISRLASPVACKTLECVIVAGEECRAEVAERHFERLPHVALFNEYGPTECTVWNTVAEISKDASRKPIGIGRPAPGAKALVLGLRGALLPEGVSGELCAGGAGIARGYLGRPDLTAERFLPNPFGGAGERLYRTGDHVRRRGDGALEFLGRIDNQVKVRGHRIEPAEIEKVLLGHRSVVEGVVVASFDENGVTKLAAFVVPLESDVDVKSFLAERLPSYMVPETIIVRESLPKLPNGKIDRSALRIGSDARHREHSAVAPAAGLTMVIAEIWRDVLGVAAVGENDDFFELGGNSLSAIQVIARVQQLLGGEISVAAIFDHGRLGEFTREVESAIVGGADVDGLSELLADVERSQETHSIRDSGTDVSESHGAEGAYNG
jgi:amino acid adenylation domain-containing protein